MVMNSLSNDFRQEGNELRAFLQETFATADWTRPTPFKNWTTEDVFQHLMVGDRLNILSMTNPERFIAVMAQRTAARAQGNKTSGVEYLDEPVGHGVDLLAQWHGQLNRLCDLFQVADAKARMKWVGPDMSIRSAATARLMETWAHGQDIYDMVGASRTATDRLRHIAVLGVNTFAWTFVNRGLQPPEMPPCIELTAPSGEVWRWNEADQDNKIVGNALDFCQVVTQGRNIIDVNLQVNGDAATQWMAIAQCFAGPAEDPPAPGTRIGQAS